MAASKKQHGGWANPPPVVVVAGSEWFFRRREIQQAKVAAKAAGRSVQDVDGAIPEVISETIDMSVLGGPALVVVSNPEDHLQLLAKHAAGANNQVGFILHHDGQLKKDSGLRKLADGLPKQWVISFNKPEKVHRYEEYAVEFILAEAKRLGISVESSLAEALVSKVGTDLGVLHFELLKVATYMSARKEGPSVKAEHIKATLAVFGDDNLTTLSNAVGSASVRAVVKEMDRLSREHPAPNVGQRTLAVCGWLGGQATKWLHVAALHLDRASEEEGASRVSVHPYIYKAFLLPVARRWGPERIVKLIRHLAKAEAAVKSSHINPWIVLETGLVASCRAVAERG